MAKLEPLKGLGEYIFTILFFENSKVFSTIKVTIKEPFFSLLVSNSILSTLPTFKPFIVTGLDFESPPILAYST